MKDVASANVPYILGIRLVLLAVIVILLVMVYRAWKKRPAESAG
jgi:hypothetical protein